MVAGEVAGVSKRLLKFLTGRPLMGHEDFVADMNSLLMTCLGCLTASKEFMPSYSPDNASRPFRWEMATSLITRGILLYDCYWRTINNRYDDGCWYKFDDKDVKRVKDGAKKFCKRLDKELGDLHKKLVDKEVDGKRVVRNSYRNLQTHYLKESNEREREVVLGVLNLLGLNTGVSEKPLREEVVSLSCGEIIRLRKSADYQGYSILTISEVSVMILLIEKTLIHLNKKPE